MPTQSPQNLTLHLSLFWARIQGLDKPVDYTAISVPSIVSVLFGQVTGPPIVLNNYNNPITNTFQSTQLHGAFSMIRVMVLRYKGVD